MASATPIADKRPNPANLRRPQTASSQLDSKPFAGVASVGVTFKVGKDLSTHNCTASAVHGGVGNLIITAGHCNPDAATVFVPMYQKGKNAADQPYGIWPVERGFRDSRRTDTGVPSDLDFAFARVKPNAKGQQLETAIGGSNVLTRATGYAQQVTVIGYPMAKYDKSDTAITCSPTTSLLPGRDQMQMVCGGYYGGVSGSAWMTGFNGRTGNIIGILGGEGTGGPNDHLSYATMAHDQMFRLYDDALNNREPVRNDAYQQPHLPYSLGTGNTWQHARLLAAGEYTGDGRSDLIVVWTDGEVTLFVGDGANNFNAEQQLVKPKSAWTEVAAITGGDFSGNNLFDLIVRWNSGEVTLISDISTAGLGASTRLAPAGSIWMHAMQLIGGRFGTAGLTTDLIVRWVDGETTLYTNTSTAGFGTEHRLQPAGDLWTHATLLASGDFTGNDNWDVMIRWSDGELDLYPDANPAGLGAEKRINDPNELWTHDLAMTAGSYNSNGHPDDLIIRWSDGETTLYANTGNTLGTEYPLVPPKV
ncbi:hypothetical protein ACIGXA_39725 [Streptomyces fildesensis]|uniref:Peptidase S1 domain-containing protein n=1 Tax=Streptomyces fildesensis TaxID=375757 RepID=A0ABW8CJK6_9ACTN